MKILARWESRLRFSAASENGAPAVTHAVKMDAKPPFGEDSALSPKQLLLAAVAGCTGMDVASLLRKAKQAPTRFEVLADGALTDQHPKVFREIVLTYRFEGALDARDLEEAVRLSQSLYCGVSAMVARAAPIRFVIELNGQRVASGESQFPTPEG